LQAGITTSQGQQRESGNRRDDRRPTLGVPEAAWARDRGTATKRNLSTAAGKTGGNPEAGWQWNAQARHSLRAGSLYSAGGIAGSAEALGPDVLRTQPRFPTGAQCEASGAPGAAVYRRRTPLGGGPRLGEIFRSSQSRPSVSGGGRARGRQANAQVDPSVSEGRSDGGGVGKCGG